MILACVLCVSLFTLDSCRSRSAGGPSLGEAADTDSTSAGVLMAAYFIPDRNEIEKRFKTFLPDSGIVSIEVTVRNGTERPVMIHTSHGLDAPEPFHGFTLTAGGDEYIPIAPIDVLSLLHGKGKPVRYKRPGIFDAVVSIALPTAVLYYGHREVSVGRHYRSIFKQSIFEATKNGTVRAIRLEPGEEATGSLFFYLPPDVNPYNLGEKTFGVDSVKAAELALTLRPSWVRVYDAIPGTEGLSDAAAAYITDAGAGETALNAERTGILFALPTGGKWRGGGMLAGLIPEVLEQGESAMYEISTRLSATAVIAGTAATSDHAACAVNFKATSKIFIVDISGPPTLLGEIDLDRKIRRIFLTEEGLLVATSEGRCRYISLDGMKERRDVKTGRDVRDLFLDGDRIFVLGGKELSIYGAAQSDPLRLIERRPFTEAKRRFVGIQSDLLYILHGSDDAGWDTLTVCERGSLEEMARTVLPAPARFSDAHGAGLLLQLDGGLLLSSIVDRASHEFKIEVVGHVPFEIALIERTENGYRVVGRDGSFAEGDIAPPLAGDLVKVVPVGVKPPEVSSSRSRAGR
jgi:hypothetical protein